MKGGTSNVPCDGWPRRELPVVLWVNNETSNAPALSIDEKLSYDNQLVQDANHYRPQDGIENTAFC